MSCWVHLLRDALIDNGSPRRDYYRAELSRLRAEVEASLTTYVPEVTSVVERDTGRCCRPS